MALIEAEVKANLANPNSYELRDLVLDSCFSDDAEHNAEAVALTVQIVKEYQLYKACVANADKAKRKMYVLAPEGDAPNYSQAEWEKAHAEYEREQSGVDAAKQKILSLFSSNEQFLRGFAGEGAGHEFTGWMATVKYRSFAPGGIFESSRVYYLDAELAHITHCFDEDDVLSIQSGALEEFMCEFREDIGRMFER